MQSTDYKNWHPSGNNVEFAEKGTYRYLEILNYPNQSEPAQKEGVLDDSTLADWLDTHNDELSVARQGKPSGGLQILTGECNLNYTTGSPILSFTRESFVRIEKHLKLPNEFLRILSAFQVRVVKFHSLAQNSAMQGLIFTIGFYRSNFYQLAVTYDVQASLTQCLIISKIADFNTSPLFKRLQEQLLYCDRLLLIPLLAMELEIESYQERITTSDLRLNTLEETMGQHEYSDRPIGNPLELDFLSTTRSLNYISKRLGVDAAGLGCLCIALESITPLTQSELNQDKMAEDKAAFLKDSCRSLLLDVEYEEKRTKMLIQVVYQFMAQKDTKVNLALARDSAVMAKASKEDSAVMRTIAVESKRDSSSMKTIAILGMFFLPGTFIAAVFAMPVFDWSNEGVPVVKKGFGYYWAVTIPLTALVLLSWAIAMLLPWSRWLSRVSKSGTLTRDDEEEIELS